MSVASIFSIIGSGSGEPVSGDRSRLVFCNSSFIRLATNSDEYELENLFLSDGMLNKDELNLKPPIMGYSSEESTSIRLAKCNLLNSCNVKNLYVVSHNRYETIKKQLANTELSFNRLILIQPRKLYWMCIYVSGLRVEFKYFISWFLSILTNRKPAPHYRPSTGLIAAIYMIYENNFDCQVKLDGFLGAQSFYGKGSNNIKQINIHYDVDKMLITTLSTRGNLC